MKTILLFRLYIGILFIKFGTVLIPKEFEKTKKFMNKLDFK